ncbi:MAG: DUF58 domain-containing protein [Agarilytica sp.]
MPILTAKPGKNAAPEGVYVTVDALLNLRHIAKELSLENNRKNVAMMDGDSRSSFRGRGMEFSEVRPYQPGDDIRNIDWRVTARTQKTHTKLFQEERERPVYIVVDQRSPMFFGSVTQFKSVFAAKIATVIAWVALQSNDRIGGFIFSDTNQTDSRARRGKHSALSFIHELVEYNQELNSPIGDPQFSMENMLNDIRRVAKPGSAVFVISDFHDFNDACQEPLAVLARHCDVTAIQIFDPLESKLPTDKFLSITNGDEKLNLGGQPQEFAQTYQSAFENRLFSLRKACNQTGVNLASTSVEQSTTALMQDLFRARRTTTRGGRT